MQFFTVTALRAVLVPLLCGAAVAQCAPVWSPIAIPPGVTRFNIATQKHEPAAVLAIHEWDPDGPGPATRKIVVGGTFDRAGGAPSLNVAAFDPVTGTWSSLGGGFFTSGGTPLAMATAPNGDLVVGGNFSLVGGQPTGGLLRWNGSSWAPFGATLGISGGVSMNAATSLPNGDLFVGGFFMSSAGDYITRWNGSAWSGLGSGTSSSVFSLAFLANGDLIVGGGFVSAGGVPATNIARWSGGAWSAIAGGTNGPVDALAALPGGGFVAAGRFTTPGAGIARFDGSAWQPLGSGFSSATVGLGPVSALAVLPGGDLVAAGQFAAVGGVAANSIARWNGATWSNFGAGFAATPDPTVTFRSLRVASNGDLYAGGFLTVAAGGPALGIAKWNGTTWSALSANLTFDGPVDVATVLDNGDLVAAGTFSAAGGVSAKGIVRRVGSTWSPIGSGVVAGSAVRTVARSTNGKFVAAGQFSSIGGVSATNVACWSGSWSALGLGLNGNVSAAVVLPNEEVIAGGTFTASGAQPTSRVARWTGTAWLPMGAGLNGPVNAVAALPSGDVIAAGAFTASGAQVTNRVARWDGSAWLPMGAGTNGTVNALLVSADASVVAAGAFTAAGGSAATNVARWNGQVWSPMGSGVSTQVLSLACLPDGDVLAGTTNAVWRWNGASWTNTGATFDGSVSALAVLPGGSMFAGGHFSLMNSVLTPSAADWIAPCVASVTTDANGCASSGGPNALVAASRPWVDATFRTQCSGLPATALVVVATGFVPTAPGVRSLASLFAEGQPGCDLLVDPDLLGLTTAVQGAAQHELFVPGVPAIVGSDFYQQWLPFEVDGSGAFVAITASNRLRATVGVF